MMRELLKGFMLEEKPTANHPVVCKDLKVKSKIVWLFWVKEMTSMKLFFHGTQCCVCEIANPNRIMHKHIMFISSGH
jgi:hypothetical protein